MTLGEWTAAQVTGADRTAPLVVACEHASAYIPPDLADLGLDATARRSHVAWDIGAAQVARALGALLDAPVVEGAMSRLVYDCNRPLSAPDAIPSRSEVFDIPGNAGLTEDDRRDRHARVYQPFHAALADALRRQDSKADGPATLVTVHSFTPVYLGQSRAVEIGILHDAASDLAEAVFRAEADRGTWKVGLNVPYSAADGVTHTLRRHGDEQSRPAVMIEIRNDLVADETAAERMARHLAETLRLALPAPVTPEVRG